MRQSTGSSSHPFKVETTNPDLLSRARKEVAAAWDELVPQYSPLVYHWARQMGLQPADAANVVQETFQSVSSHLQTFDAQSVKGSFRSWLKTITINKARDLLRKKAKQVQAVGGTDWQNNVQNMADVDPIQLLEANDHIQKDPILNAALDLVRDIVTERTFRAFSLLVFQGWKSTEVAEELGMTAHAVRMAKVRVSKQLRDIIKNQEGASP